MLTCTAHICLIYKGTDIYSLIMKYNIIHLIFLSYKNPKTLTNQGMHNFSSSDTLEL